MNKANRKGQVELLTTKAVRALRLCVRFPVIGSDWVAQEGDLINAMRRRQKQYQATLVEFVERVRIRDENADESVGALMESDFVPGMQDLAAKIEAYFIGTGAMAMMANAIKPDLILGCRPKVLRNSREDALSTDGGLYLYCNMRYEPESMSTVFAFKTLIGGFRLI